MSEKLNEAKLGYELKDGKVFYQGIESPIDAVKESRAIEKFLNKYWDVKVENGKPLSEITDEVLYEGIHRGIAYQEIETEKIPGFSKSSDFKRSTSEKETSYFSTCAESLTRKAKKEWKMTASPKGYRRYVKEYGEKSDTERFEENKKLEFDGSDFNCSLGATCPDFKEWMSIYHVRYEHYGQGYQPIETLTECILRQGMNIGIQCVEKKYKDEVKAFYKKTDDEFKSFWENMPAEERKKLIRKLGEKLNFEVNKK